MGLHREIMSHTVQQEGTPSVRQESDSPLQNVNRNITESNQGFMTPPQMPILQHPVHVRHGQDRPLSAHQHRMTLCGRLLRAMGDEYQCRTCGRSLRVMGDQMAGIYALRRVASSDVLSEQNSRPHR